MCRLVLPSVASADELGLLLLRKEARFDELPFLEVRTFSESVADALSWWVPGNCSNRER
ncbi:hypothetical protein Hanom_Chr00s000001g01595071 [Helianthus anomalus]